MMKRRGEPTTEEKKRSISRSSLSFKQYVDSLILPVASQREAEPLSLAACEMAEKTLRGRGADEAVLVASSLLVLKFHVKESLTVTELRDVTRCFDIPNSVVVQAEVLVLEACGWIVPRI